MKYNLEPHIEQEICELAQKNNLKKVILFGSRARGDNHERSDIDLAVSGGDVVTFSLAADEEISTLLTFDVINLAQKHSQEFLDEIKKDGVVLYEKV